MEGGDGLPGVADVLAAGGGLGGADVLAGGLLAVVPAEEDAVETEDDPSRASKALALVPAIHSVSKFLARLRITFSFR